MSQQALRKRYKKKTSPFDSLLLNPWDEESWYELFGEKLRTHVCVVVIRERISYRKMRDEYESYYHRENLAFCQEEW